MRTIERCRVPLSMLALVVAGAACAGEKAPFHVLFSNDMTNTTTCTSPYHKKGESFRPEVLEATVDETAGHGIDVHMLQPGLGWVPMWKSRVYPVEEHFRWLKERYGAEPDTFGRAVLGGADLVKLFVERCHLRGQKAFISYRLNDSHHKEFADAKPGEKVSGGSAQGLSRFYCEHPEWRISNDLKSWHLRVQNWAVPEVRAHKFAFLEELCANYDIDGLELDYMRHCNFFQPDKTTSEQRREIMAGFVKQVRELLDRTAKPGQHRCLCVRIPCFLAAHDPLGIDVAAFAEAGAEMFNLSPYYIFEQQNDSVAIRKRIPNAAVYVEFTHDTRNGPRPTATVGYDDFSFRRATVEQIQTTAHLAYARGLDGVSAFNFVYYREHGTPMRGPFDEPPFDVFNHLGDPAWLARQPQHYFVAQATWDVPAVPDRRLGSGRKPLRANAGETVRVELDGAPPAGGWSGAARLRIQTAKDLTDQRLSVKLNGTPLEADADIREPYPNPYSPLLATAETLRAWRVPADILRDGPNQIDVKLESGAMVELLFVDLAAGGGK